MSAIIEAKKQLVDEIAEVLSNSVSTVIVDYRGLTVAEVTDLRSQLREAGVEYKVYKNTMVRRAAEKAGIVHASIGKVSFTDKQLIENFNTLQDVLAKAKPSSAKGTYFKSVAVTTTMGPGVKIDTASL